MTDSVFSRFAVAVVFSAVALGAHAAGSFEFSGPPGPYAVGLKAVQKYDYTRAFKPVLDINTGLANTGERARPMQMLVWYPASKAGKAVSYGDYIRLDGTEDDIALKEDEIERVYQGRVKRIVASKGSAALASQELARPMRAVRDAPAAAGKFPLVVYAASFSSTASENVDLCEYLASHGYVVIAIPSMGTHSHGQSTDLEGLEAQVSDIGFAMAHAHTLAQVDLGKSAVMGFSWGGLANVMAAAKDNRIKALVSLDGSVRYFPQLVDSGKEAAPYVTPARVAVPLLYMAARPKSMEVMQGQYDLSFNFMNAMKYSDVYRVTMWPMEHGDFASSGLHTQNPARFKEYSLDEVSAAHSWMARYVLNFLNARLKGDASGEVFFSNAPTVNGAPPHMSTVEVIRAKGAPPTLESFAAQLYSQGFSNAQQVLDSYRKLEPKFQLPENELNRWAYNLLQAGQVKAAIEVFKVNVALYPASFNVYDSLAEGYATNKETALAVQNYKKSLELNPRNTNAVEQLEQLATQK